mgnify:CR=1 FL=1
MFKFNKKKFQKTLSPISELLDNFLVILKVLITVFKICSMLSIESAEINLRLIVFAGL